MIKNEELIERMLAVEEILSETLMLVQLSRTVVENAETDQSQFFEDSLSALEKALENF